jgi:hypothetical protein
MTDCDRGGETGYPNVNDRNRCFAAFETAIAPLHIE